jgi:hypothetical protein
MAASSQLGNQGRGEDQDIGWRTGQQLVAHGADRAEAAADVEAGLRLERRGDRRHQALCRASTEDLEPHCLAPSPLPR